MGETKKYKEMVATYKPMWSMRWPYVCVCIYT